MRIHQWQWSVCHILQTYINILNIFVLSYKKRFTPQKKFQIFLLACLFSCVQEEKNDNLNQKMTFMSTKINLITRTHAYTYYKIRWFQEHIHDTNPPPNQKRTAVEIDGSATKLNHIKYSQLELANNNRCVAHQSQKNEFREDSGQ